MLFMIACALSLSLSPPLLRATPAVAKLRAAQRGRCAGGTITLPVWTISPPPSLPIGAAPGASSPAGVLCCVCDGPSPFNPYLSFL